MQDLLNSLNSAGGSGVGLYGSFSLDSTGALAFTPNTPGTSVSVVSDQTQRGAGGPSISQLFGLGATTQAARTNLYSVRADIAANPSKLATATLDQTAAAGTPALSIGDGSGALKLSQAGATQVTIDTAGGLNGATTTVTQYAALLGGALGSQAAAASQANTSATAVQTEADARRSSAEGVNLDQELVNLTTYQQAYSASARLVTATSDMFSTLLTMMGN
jgi:flagellar hook-associated protein 1 FlgK